MRVELHQLKLHEAQKMLISSYFNLYKAAIKLSHDSNSLDKIFQRKILNHPPSGKWTCLVSFGDCGLDGWVVTLLGNQAVMWVQPAGAEKACSSYPCRSSMTAPWPQCLEEVCPPLATCIILRALLRAFSHCQGGSGCLLWSAVSCRKRRWGVSWWTTRPRSLVPGFHPK